MIEFWKGRWADGRFSASRLGKEVALNASLLNKIISAAANLITLTLVARKFTVELQGYYFAIQSFLALIVVLEFGFGGVLVQFISHEWAFVRAESRNIEGHPVHVSKIREIMLLAMVYYRKLAAFSLFVVTPIGYAILRAKGANLYEHLIPWFLIGLFLVPSILCMPLRYILEGSGKFVESEMSRFIGLLVSNTVGWLLLLGDVKIYSFAAMTFCLGLVDYWILNRLTLPYRLISSENLVISQELRESIWRHERRIAPSWLCGYICYQSFYPALFIFQGPVIAGEFGPTLQIYFFTISFGLTWVTVNAPKFGVLGAGRDFSSLRALVRRTSWTAASITALFSMCVWAAFFLIESLQLHVYNASVNLIILGILLLCASLGQFQSTETTAIWFQKQNPFLLINIGTAVLVLASNCIFAKIGSSFGMIASFFIITNLLAWPASHLAYNRAIGRLCTSSTE